MPIFSDDPRVRIHWTIAPGSDFAADTDASLTRLGVRLIPWSEACSTSYRLVVATSGNGDLHRLSGPLLLLPHGAGFSKVVAPGESAPAGLAPRQLLHGTRVIADVIGLEHPDQLGRLAAYCPPAADRGIVLGDPTRDRLTLGARLRSVYRRALGVPEHCSLVVLSSTWGSRSLLDSLPDLPFRLAAALPFDEYRLAAIVHPNTAARLGAWEVGRLLLRSRAAGLRLVPADRWEGALLGADLVIGDHGSVSLYAAASGTRLLLGAYDDGQIVADSPMAALAAGVPRLDPSGNLAAQVQTALAQDLQAPAYLQASEITGALGRSLEVTQCTAYRLLGLPRPTALPHVRAPEPVEGPPPAPRATHLVLGTHDPRSGVDVVLRRFAPDIDPDLLVPYEAFEICRHVVAHDGELDVRLRDSAEVLLLGTPATSAATLAAALSRESTCVYAVAAADGPGRCMVAARGIGLLRLVIDDARVDAAVLPSVLLAVVSQEHGEYAAALKRLRAGVSVRIGRFDATVTAYDPAYDPAPAPSSSPSSC